MSFFVHPPPQHTHSHRRFRTETIRSAANLVVVHERVIDHDALRAAHPARHTPCEVSAANSGAATCAAASSGAAEGLVSSMSTRIVDFKHCSVTAEVMCLHGPGSSSGKRLSSLGSGVCKADRRTPPRKRWSVKTAASHRLGRRPCTQGLSARSGRRWPRKANNATPMEIPMSPHGA